MFDTGAAWSAWVVSGTDGKLEVRNAVAWKGSARDSKESGMDRQGRLRTAKVRTSQDGWAGVRWAGVRAERPVWIGRVSFSSSG